MFKSVSISELLAHFKSYMRRNEAEACERKLLAGKTKLLESLTERNAHLEEQVLGMSRTEVGVYTNSSVEPLVMSALNKGHLSLKDACFNSELLLFYCLPLNIGHLCVKDTCFNLVLALVLPYIHTSALS